MNTEKINYFIYARKSSEPEGRQVLSIPGQLQDLDLLIKREYLRVIETITETRSAMKPHNRPAYTDMIKRLKRGKATGLVVWHVDRLARNQLEFGELIYLLQMRVIKSIWTPTREYRSEDSAILIALEASMATQFSIDLGHKVTRGLIQKCELGQPPLLARLGYLNTKFPEHGTNLVIEDPERWHIVRMGFDMLLSRKYTVAQIAKILSEDYGLRSRPTKTKPGRLIYKSMLYKMFIDPYYSGYFYYGGKLYKGTYTAMITVEEFDQIQVILGRKDRPRRKKHEFAFTGLMTCGGCGCAITASEKTKFIKSTGEYKSYLFYHCTKRKESANCTEKRYTKVKDLEKMIVKELSEYFIDPYLREWGIKLLQECEENEHEKQNALIKETSEIQQKIESEIDVLLDLRIGSHITEAQYLAKKSEKELQLIRIQDKKEHLKLDENKWLDKVEFVLNAIDQFQTGDPTLQKEVCLNFGWNWTLCGQKLFIDKPKWFEPIKKCKKEVDADFGTLEPRKTFETYGEKRALELLRPLMSGLRNEVRKNGL